MLEKLNGLGLDEETAKKVCSLLEEEVNAAKGETEKMKQRAAELEKTRLENAQEIGLLKAGGKNLRVLKALIDRDKLSLDEGVISGLDEQIEALKKDDATSFLFESDGVKLIGVSAAEASDITEESLSYEGLCEIMK